MAKVDQRLAPGVSDLKRLVDLPAAEQSAYLLDFHHGKRHPLFAPSRLPSNPVIVDALCRSPDWPDLLSVEATLTFGGTTAVLRFNDTPAREDCFVGETLFLQAETTAGGQSWLDLSSERSVAVIEWSLLLPSGFACRVPDDHRPDRTKEPKVESRGLPVEGIRFTTLKHAGFVILSVGDLWVIPDESTEAHHASPANVSNSSEWKEAAFLRADALWCSDFEKWSTPNGRVATERLAHALRDGDDGGAPITHVAFGTLTNALNKQRARFTVPPRSPAS